MATLWKRQGRGGGGCFGVMESGGGVWDKGCNELVGLIGSPLSISQTHTLTMVGVLPHPTILVFLFNMCVFQPYLF